MLWGTVTSCHWWSVTTGKITWWVVIKLRMGSDSLVSFVPTWTFLDSRKTSWQNQIILSPKVPVSPEPSAGVECLLLRRYTTGSMASPGSITPKLLTPCSVSDPTETTTLFLFPLLWTILAKALLFLSLLGKLEMELTKENLQQKKGNYKCPSSLDN